MTETLALRKARGAFYTPSEMSRFIVDWALRSSEDTALEPSCGEASFLLAAAERLRRLGAPDRLRHGQLRGIELDPAATATARDLMKRERLAAEITNADFFDVAPRPIYDAVIGNPPYVRYQSFTGTARAKSQDAARAHGVRINGLASSWAAFTVQAAQWLKPEGRLGLVLPAELLAVKYAAQVRRYLLQRFASVRLVLFKERVFPGVLQEIVLLLAEGPGPAIGFEVTQAESLRELRRHDGLAWSGFHPEKNDKWTGALLPKNSMERFRELLSSERFCRLLDWGDTYLGAVTGNNSYFALTSHEARARRIPARELLAISPPGSRHLRGLSLSRAAWESLARRGARCHLFYPDLQRRSPAARDYINSGERSKVDRAYKCRNRTPWWRVPLVRKPDLLLTYMDHDRPRLTTNRAAVHHLNSIYGVRLKPERRALGRELLPMACLNSLTILGSEMVGRSYGGGLLKLEPTEADLLPVPSSAFLEAAAGELRPLRPLVVDALRRGRPAEATEVVDGVLLRRNLEQSEETIRLLREARELLFSRRASRGRTRNGSR